MAFWIRSLLLSATLIGILLKSVKSATPQAYRRDPGHPQWHHGAFQDVKDSIRSDVRRMLHSRAEVFDVKSRKPLRRLGDHSRPVHLVQFPRVDKLHLFSGGDDAVVKYWDVTLESQIHKLLGHKDYVRCGDASPASDDMFVTGSYDHTVRVSNGSSMEVNHGKPVEDVIYLPSGGLIATAGGNTVKIWDIIGGGKLLHSMESHNKTVTSLCMGKIGSESGEEANQYRILSVSLDGYLDSGVDFDLFEVGFSLGTTGKLLAMAADPSSTIED